jgi:hypothetical protein
MAKRKKKDEARAQVLELLHGGQPVPAKIGRVLSKPRSDAAFAQETALQLQAARARRRLVKPSKKSPRELETAGALRAITDRVAERKPALPTLVSQPGIAFGSYTVVATPPY